MQTSPGLRPLRHALGRLLIEQHVSMAASIVVIERKGVASEDAREPRKGSRLLLWVDVSAAKIGPRSFYRAAVAVVLAGPILAPSLRVGGVGRYGNEAEIGVLG